MPRTEYPVLSRHCVGQEAPFSCPGLALASRGMQFQEAAPGGARPHSSHPESFALLISWPYLDLPTGSSFYLALYNLLNFPAGVVPVTTVTPQDEEELAFYRGYYGDGSDKNFQEVRCPLCLSPCWSG